MLEIKIDSSFTLNDLLKIKSEGYKVLKTPHVGNQYMNNLIIALLNFEVLVYDRNIGIKDLNFHPQSIIFGYKEYKTFQDKILTTHAEKIVDDKYCINIITQTSAIKSAISSLEDIMLESHLAHCLHKETNKNRLGEMQKEIIKVYKLKRK